MFFMFAKAGKKYLYIKAMIVFLLIFLLPLNALAAMDIPGEEIIDSNKMEATVIAEDEQESAVTTKDEQESLMDMLTIPDEAAFQLVKRTGILLDGIVDRIDLTYWYIPEEFYAKWSAENPNYIDSVGKFKSGTDVNLSIDWSIKNLNAKAGDYFSVNISGGIIDPGNKWQLPQIGNITENGDPKGQVVASYIIDKDSNSDIVISFEFTEFVEQNINAHGNFWLMLVTSEFSAEETTRDISLSINGQLMAISTVETLPPAPAEERDPKNSNYDKWGISDIKQIAGDLYYFTWDIWLNMDFNTIENFYLEDIIPEGSPHRFISPEYANELGDSKLGTITIKEYIGADDPSFNTDSNSRYNYFKKEFTSWNWVNEIHYYNLYDAPQRGGVDGGGGIDASFISLSNKSLKTNLGRVTRPLIITYYTIAEIELAERALGSYDTVSQFVNTVYVGSQEVKTSSLQTAWFAFGGSASGYNYGFDFTKVDETGNPLGNARFSLYADENCDGPVQGLYSSDNNGRVSFSNLRYGTYYLKETSTPEGYEPNATIYKVVIGSDGNTEIFYGEGFNKQLTSMQIENVKPSEPVLPEPVEIVFKAQKILTGEGSELNTGMFNFKLQNAAADDENDYDAAENDETGVITFKPIQFTEAGTHQYIISEENGTADNLSYDPTLYYVTVQIVENDGKLEKVITYTKDDDEVEQEYNENEIAFVFINSYVNEIESAQISIQALKVLTGEVLSEGLFAFELKEDGNVIETVYNNDDGTITFTPIIYENAGIYEYTINEKNDSIADYTYDDTIYKAAVTIAEKDGALQGEVTYIAGNGEDEIIVNEAVFNNNYLPTEDEETTVPPTEDEETTVPPTEEIPSSNNTSSDNTSSSDDTSTSDDTSSYTAATPVSIADVPNLSEVDPAFIIYPEQIPAGYAAVPYNDDVYIIYDDNNLPLGYLTVPDGESIDNIDIANEMIPLGEAEIKTNPKTGDNSRNNSVKYILIVSIYLSFIALYIYRILYKKT